MRGELGSVVWHAATVAREQLKSGSEFLFFSLVTAECGLKILSNERF